MSKTFKSSEQVLPLDSELSIQSFVQIFQRRTASYKFILFKAILDKVTDKHKNKSILSFRDLTIRSISEIWYSIDTFKFNLGYSDQFVHWIKSLEPHVPTNIIKQGVEYLERFLLSAQNEVRAILNIITDKFSKMVPYRLIRPWFTQELEGIKDHKINQNIQKLSQTDTFSFYQIHTMIDERVLTLSVNEDWIQYLRTNEKIIRGWWLSEYVSYLQNKNPTMLAIQNKLAPPSQRNMNRIKTLYQKYYYDYKEESPTCLYTGETLDIISHDHVIPWSFLGADPLYNFVPTSKSTNSSKSDHIIHFSYLRDIAQFQYKIFNFIRCKEKKYLDEFVLDLKFNDMNKVTSEIFIDHYEDYFRSLAESAMRQGFTGNWKVAN